MNVVFVFGSNTEGRHGKGAALIAKEQYGAKYGIGVGRTGNAYAIPTKNKHPTIYRELVSMSLDQIRPHIVDFFDYAAHHMDEIFLLTPIGCGLAQHKKSDMVKLIRQFNIPDNVVFDRRWFKE